MLTKRAPWELKAAEKRAHLHAQIPKKWLLDQTELDKASKQRNITGPFIEQYLRESEIAITNLPATVLVSKLSTGELSAFQVTEAFCRRTAIAQQIVPEPPFACRSHMLQYRLAEQLLTMKGELPSRNFFRPSDEAGSGTRCLFH